MTTRASGRGLLLACAVAALVLGILGMHALDLHAAPGPHDAMTAAAHEQPGDPVAAPDDGGGHPMGGMVMLCTAMLVAAGVVLLAALALRRTPWGGEPGPPLRLGVRRLTRPLPNGPPPTCEFSVIRC